MGSVAFNEVDLEYSIGLNDVYSSRILNYWSWDI